MEGAVYGRIVYTDRKRQGKLMAIVHHTSMDWLIDGEGRRDYGTFHAGKSR